MSETPNLPKAAEIIREIERLGFDWEFIPQFDISALDIETRVQVRNTGNVAPKEMVDKYSVSMRYDQFPPIVATVDNKTIDGNTRVAAKKKMGGDTFLPAIVIKAEFNKLDHRKQLQLTRLGFRLNGSNGKPMDKAEQIRNARIGIELGLRIEEIGKDGISKNQIEGLKLEMAAEAKMNTAGINVKFDDQTMQWQVDGNPVKSTMLRSLGKQQNINLPNQPFAELADLTMKAGLTDKEVQSLGKQAISTGSEAGMLDTIRAEKSRCKERIEHREMYKPGSAPVNHAEVLYKQLTALVKFKGVEDTAVCTDADQMQARVELLDTAIAVLTEVRRIQAI